MLPHGEGTAQCGDEPSHDVHKQVYAILVSFNMHPAWLLASLPSHCLSPAVLPAFACNRTLCNPYNIWGAGSINSEQQQNEGFFEAGVESPVVAGI